MTVVLRVGTAVSTALLALGVVLALAVPQARGTHTLLTAGLVILMAMPVANLVIALVDEIAAREWAFAALGSVVLLLLGGSLLLAFS